MRADKTIVKDTEIQKVRHRYQDVNKNEVKFRGKIPVDIEYENNKQKMPLLITERNDITPLLGMDWLKKFKLTIGNIRLDDNNQSEKRQIVEKFPDLFKNNTTIKDAEINIQLKPGHHPVKQKARPILLHLQEAVGKEIEKLTKSGHLERVKQVDEDCFVSPVVITVKNDKSVKIALDSRKLNDSCIKVRPHMPNMEELLNQISVEITKDRLKELMMSKIDLDYAYGQMMLSEETSRQCVFAITGGNFSGYYRFKKGFYGLADIPTIFQEKIDRTLEYCTPAWLDDIIVVTRGDQKDQKKKLFDVLKKLEDAGYRASEKKSEFFQNKMKRLGHEIDEEGIKPNKEKVKAILDLKHPENPTETIKIVSRGNTVPSSVSGTEHTVTTESGRIIHRKHISGPIVFQTEKKKERAPQIGDKITPKNRHCLRGVDGKYIQWNEILRDILNGKLKIIQNRTHTYESESESEEGEID